MNEPFILEVSYQNQTHELPAAFQRYGFTYSETSTIIRFNAAHGYG